MAQPKRPKGCPLFLHRNGQWCKKVKNRFRYFGSDLEAALKRWADEKDHLLAGYDPPRIDSKPTIAELANLYLANSRERAKSGEVRLDHTAEIESVMSIVIDAVGERSKPDLYTPQNWSKIRSSLATGKSGRTVAQATLQGRLARFRAFLNWCQRQELVKPLNTAGELLPPQKRLLRRESASKGKLLWGPADLRTVIDGSPVQFKPVILLAINTAMGATDIANLTRSQITPKTEFLDCPRNKTGIERRVWLWPETREAIAKATAKRADPDKQKYQDRLLLTVRGLPWARVERDGGVNLTADALSRAKRSAGISGPRTMYDCRRTFRTVASTTCDLEAINHCMGHEGAGEGSTYLQGVSDERIKRVCESVRGWLYAEVAE